VAVQIIDAYFYPRFCKSRACYALGQANNLKRAILWEVVRYFTNHAGYEIQIMEKDVMAKGLQVESSTSSKFQIELETRRCFAALSFEWLAGRTAK
jgi:hypothetical protein